MLYKMILSKLLLLFIGICLSINACSDKSVWQSPHPKSQDEQWISHAGGLVNEMDHTNSLEALKASHQLGAHLIELDFEWTKDGHLVLLHDWHKSITKLFAQAPGKRTLAQFIALKTPDSLTPMTIEELFVWMDAHPNVLIIADIKSHELLALKWIQIHYPAYAERFIPEITNFNQYEPVRKLGYFRVILNLWVTKYKDHEVLNFCKTHPVWAVAMTGEHVLKGTLTKDLHGLQIPVYAFTINDTATMKRLFRAGVFGIYTDKYSLRFGV